MTNVARLRRNNRRWRIQNGKRPASMPVAWGIMAQANADAQYKRSLVCLTKLLAAVASDQVKSMVENMLFQLRRPDVSYHATNGYQIRH